MIATVQILNLLTLGGLAILALLCGYLWFLALVHFFTWKNSGNCGTNVCRTRFAFVVPAYNEEAGITETVRSLKGVDYPSGLFDVFVIADNCTDKTAELARKEGAVCLERFDGTQKGKGYALRFAFDRILPGNYDAVAVVDADTVVSKYILSGLNARIQEGQKVIQTWVGLSNHDASILTYLFQVGNLVENMLYWKPKEKLGLPVLLRGNGMCFTREILEKCPWASFSIVEDTEYGIKLLEHGVNVRFAPEIRVFARQPENLEQAYVQRVRWASGNASLTKRRALHFISRGICMRDIRWIDAGITLLTGSRPLLLIANSLLIALAMFLGNTVAVTWGVFLLMGQVLYICVAVVINGLSARNMIRLFLSPFYLMWLCAVSVLGLAGYRKDQWLRTNRT